MLLELRIRDLGVIAGADLVLEAGMTLVVQPNVTTPDHRAGVQTGELVLVTESGAESLHAVPGGPWVGA